MEVLTAIIAALGGLSETVVKDAYNGLKSLISKKFGPQHDVTQAVEKLEQQPESQGRRQTLQEELSRVKANEDGELIAAAKALIEKIKTQPGGSERIATVQQTVTGNFNIFSGTGDVTVRGPQSRS